MTEATADARPLAAWQVRLDRTATRIEWLLDAALVLMLTVLVVSLIWQVFGRYVLDKAPAWSEELARYLMVWITMLGSAVVMRENGHIGVTFVLDLLSPGARKIVLVVRDLIVLAVAYVLVTSGLQLTELLSGQLSAAFEVSMAIPYGALPVGGLLIAVMVVVARLTRSRYARGLSTPIG
jgi:TRAP-type C4-dicarboxylate transport system permease small subunit